MGFGAKTKTLSRLASANALYRNDNKTFGPIVQNDSVLLGYQQAMVVILGAIKSKFIGGSSANNIAAPLPFPVPTARWMGRLAMDSTTKGTNTKGKVVYTYDHLKAFQANANGFRGRVDDIIKYTSMEDDMLNSVNTPNPGGQAGTHGDAPVIAPLVHAAPGR